MRLKAAIAAGLGAVYTALTVWTPQISAMQPLHDQRSPLPHTDTSLLATRANSPRDNPVATRGTFATYTVEWATPDRTEYGFTLNITSSSQASAASRSAFVPSNGEWALLMRWNTTHSVTMSDYSSTTGHLRPLAGADNTYVFTSLASKVSSITFHVNVKQDIAATDPRRNAGLLPTQLVAYNVASPNLDDPTVLLRSGYNYRLMPVASSLPTAPPSQFRSLQPVDNDFAASSSADTRVTSPAVETRQDQAADTKAKNPYGTVLEATPIGLYLYCAVTGVGALVYLWGLIFRLRCRRRTKGVQNYSSYEMSQ
ncbi:hypothetical protein H4R35_002261 [Dimargaris xerosporica]|nr:hypothetical protein H4R35_002261 [Dimargaris xerosporica]